MGATTSIASSPTIGIRIPHSNALSAIAASPFSMTRRHSRLTSSRPTSTKNRIRVSFCCEPDSISGSPIRSNSPIEAGTNADSSFIATDVLVDELIVDDGKVVGIRSAGEDFHANCVIIAEGVNNLLTRQIGLQSAYVPPKGMANRGERGDPTRSEGP